MSMEEEGKREERFFKFREEEAERIVNTSLQ